MVGGSERRRWVLAIVDRLEAVAVPMRSTAGTTTVAIDANWCYKWHMTSIGVRELRQRASEYLRRVEAGETLEVTDRGRPVALLMPIPSTSRLEQLGAGGDLSEPVGDLDDLPGPLDLQSGQEPPSAVLARFELLRIDDRVLVAAGRLRAASRCAELTRLFLS